MFRILESLTGDELRTLFKGLFGTAVSVLGIGVSFAEVREVFQIVAAAGGFAVAVATVWSIVKSTRAKVARDDAERIKDQEAVCNLCNLDPSNCPFSEDSRPHNCRRKK